MIVVQYRQQIIGNTWKIWWDFGEYQTIRQAIFATESHMKNSLKLLPEFFEVLSNGKICQTNIYEAVDKLERIYQFSFIPNPRTGIGEEESPWKVGLNET